MVIIIINIVFTKVGCLSQMKKKGFYNGTLIVQTLKKCSFTRRKLYFAFGSQYVR